MRRVLSSVVTFLLSACGGGVEPSISFTHESASSAGDFRELIPGTRPQGATIAWVSFTLVTDGFFARNPEPAHLAVILRHRGAPTWNTGAGVIFGGVARWDTDCAAREPRAQIETWWVRDGAQVNAVHGSQCSEVLRDGVPYEVLLTVADDGVITVSINNELLSVRDTDADISGTGLFFGGVWAPNGPWRATFSKITSGWY